MDKLWYIQTREYYSALKRNKLLRHQTTHRNLKCILPSKRSQSKKATHYDSNYMLSEKDKIMDTPRGKRELQRNEF